jgi:hypothetical protein
MHKQQRRQQHKTKTIEEDLGGSSVQIPLAPMGVLAPGSAQARPSARRPIDTSGNFPAPVSADSPSNIRNPRKFFEITPLDPPDI